jgi:DNA topoisomerase-1
MEEAQALLAQPKPRGRAARAAAAPPLKELGQDSASGKPIVLREGRFGPYVTDGETNASLRKSDAVESITPQRAIELLAERRAAAPAPKRRTTTARKPASKAKTTKSARAAKPAKSGD